MFSVEEADVSPLQGTSAFAGSVPNATFISNFRALFFKPPIMSVHHGKIDI